MREIKEELKDSFIERAGKIFKRAFIIYSVICICSVNFYLAHKLQPKPQKVELKYSQVWNKTKIQSCAREWAKFYSIPENIVFGLIEAESGYRIDAVSNAGAMGLCQIMPTTFKMLAGNEINDKGVNPFDPNVNIKYGVKYLSQLKTTHKTWTAALSAYNSGKHDARYTETLAYVDRVLSIADYK
jgi:soluble lytic murein transglycosylase-like protein